MKKILIIGMDGLQMSQINKLNMPNLLKFQNQGFSFKNHHSSFPTVTRTNVASIVSGVNPGTHGILGNNMVFREYNKNKVLPVMYPEMKKIHELNEQEPNQNSQQRPQLHTYHTQIQNTRTQTKDR